MKTVYAAAFAAALISTSTVALASSTGLKPTITNTSSVLSDIDLTINTDQNIGGLGGVDLGRIDVVTQPGHIVVPKPDVENAIEFIQTNTGDVYAEKKLYVNGVEEMEASATAIANVVNIDVEGGLALEGTQSNGGNVVSKLDITSRHGKTTDVTATAIANAINATTTGDAVFDLNQANHGHEVVAILDADIQGRRTAQGEVNTAATAIGNVVNIELDGVAIGSVTQANTADITAINRDRIDVWKDPATATAIANAINITKGSLD
jgi:hypothetical protein